jgi:hypothetical protein
MWGNFLLRHWQFPLKMRFLRKHKRTVLFIYYLYNEAVSNEVFIASNDQ